MVYEYKSLIFFFFVRQNQGDAKDSNVGNVPLGVAKNWSALFFFAYDWQTNICHQTKHIFHSFFFLLPSNPNIETGKIQYPMNQAHNSNILTQFMNQLFLLAFATQDCFLCQNNTQQTGAAVCARKFWQQGIRSFFKTLIGNC